MSDFSPAACYLAAEGFAETLEEELARAGIAIHGWHGNLAITEMPPIEAAWALDIWTAPRLVPVPSVKAGADALRAMQRNWSLLPVEFHRRSALIADRLPPVAARPLHFPQAPPASHLGAWTLLAPDLMLASPTKSSPFVNGECRFEEDRIGPPSRAYLKLWEACTRLGAWPGHGDRCIDLGASPGGWTWALAQLGAEVLAVDRAPLDPRVAAMPGVRMAQASAFTMPPEPCDWLFSDIIAYPDKLLELVRAWIEGGSVGHVVCTLKFQGATDHDTADAFRAIPGGRLMHLFHNKHELTFVWTRPEHP